MQNLWDSLPNLVWAVLALAGAALLGAGLCRAKRALRRCAARREKPPRRPAPK